MNTMGTDVMVNTHQFASEILRQYDIRGTIGETLNRADAYALGFHFAKILTQRSQKPSNTLSVAVGRDGRLSSPMLAEALCAGLTEAGVNVIILPTGPTPMLYFAENFCATDGGIMVTGSHNPAHMNGFKMVMGHRPFYGKDITELGRCAANIAMILAEVPGTMQIQDIRSDYTKHLLAEAFHWPADFAPSVVWDAGNGAAGEIMRFITEKLPGRHINLFADIDGNFPNHHPDPTVPKNLVDLHKAMIKHHADFGFAFDGDGDRIGVMLQSGEILWGDRLMMLLASDVLMDSPKSMIIADVKSSDKLFDYIEDLGGIPEICPTGHAIVKTRMRETGAPLAGEMSGHIFFADRNDGYDDGLYAAMRLLTAIARQGGDLASIAAKFPKLIATPEVRLPCPENQKARVIAETQARLNEAGIDFLAIDGMRVTTDQGWWLIRASNTEPILVLRAEASNHAELDRLWLEIMSYVTKAGLSPIAYDQ